MIDWVVCSYSPARACQSRSHMNVSYNRNMLVVTVGGYMSNKLGYKFLIAKMTLLLKYTCCLSFEKRRFKRDLLQKRGRLLCFLIRTELGRQGDPH